MSQGARVADDHRPKHTDMVVWRGVARYRHDRALESHYQGLWFTLARLKWNSLVLVPADRGESTAGIATALADVGRRLRNSVTFLVMAGAVDYASASKFVSVVAGKHEQPSDEPATSRVVVAVPSVIADPLALAVCDAADAVALYVRRGHTHRRAAARTIELVGRERLVGCVLS